MKIRTIYLVFFLMLTSCAMITKETYFAVENKPKYTEYASEAHLTLKLDKVSIRLNVAPYGYNIRTLGPILPIFPAFDMWSDLHWQSDSPVTARFNFYSTEPFDVDFTKLEVISVEGKKLKAKVEVKDQHKFKDQNHHRYSFVEVLVIVSEKAQDLKEFKILGVSIKKERRLYNLPEVHLNLKSEHKLRFHLCPCR